MNTRQVNKKSGKKIKKSMVKQYGKKKGEAVKTYAMENSGKVKGEFYSKKIKIPETNKKIFPYI